MLSREYAVEVESLCKHYRRWPGAWSRALELASLGRRCTHSRHQALRHVTFRLPRGGALGVVGPNGAGKSTLLRVLAGISAPSSGRYRTQGRMAALLELGCGFHPDFSGRENVLMNGVLLGASRREVRARTAEILEFAGLGEVADEPLRTYSTGMLLRLGFSTAMGLDPEVLILDEVFAVGDLRFQKRCVDRLFAFRRGGGTLLFASHSLYDLRQICDDVLWLNDGAVAGFGDSARVTNDYAAWQTLPERSTSEAPLDSPRILSVEARDGRGEVVRTLQSGSSLTLRVRWEDPRQARAPLHLGLTFTRQDATLLAGVGTHLDGLALEGAGGECELHLPHVALLAGSFTVIAHLFDEHGVHRFHEHALTYPLVVRNDTREVGLVRLTHDWQFKTDRDTDRATDRDTDRDTDTVSGNPPEEQAA